MTIYFDNKHEQLRRLKEQVARVGHMDSETQEAIERLEDGLLFDCQLVSLMPGFPDDLKRGMQKIIAARATEPLAYAPADDEDDAACLKRLDDLVFDLHSLFHSLAQRDIGFSDGPTSNLHAWIDPLQDLRLAVMRKEPRFAEAVQRHERGVARARGTAP